MLSGHFPGDPPSPPYTMTHTFRLLPPSRVTGRCPASVFDVRTDAVVLLLTSLTNFPPGLNHTVPALASTQISKLLTPRSSLPLGLLAGLPHLYGYADVTTHRGSAFTSFTPPPPFPLDHFPWLLLLLPGLTGLEAALQPLPSRAPPSFPKQRLVLQPRSRSVST
jgi:hypothetical protein